MSFRPSIHPCIDPSVRPPIRRSIVPLCTLIFGGSWVLWSTAWPVLALIIYAIYFIRSPASKTDEKRSISLWSRSAGRWDVSLHICSASLFPMSCHEHNIIFIIWQCIGQFIYHQVAVIFAATFYFHKRDCQSIGLSQSVDDSLKKIPLE